MSIYDDARTLGNTIKESEEAIKVAKARETYEQDDVAIALVDEYAKLKGEWEAIMADSESDKAPLTELGEKIVAKEKEIKENPSTLALLQAESEFGAFVNSIFGLISATIQGEDVPQGGCSPSSCASCGGGCH